MPKKNDKTPNIEEVMLDELEIALDEKLKKENKEVAREDIDTSDFNLEKLDLLEKKLGSKKEK